VLADPKEGACALMIAAGVLGTMMVMALGLRRLDIMQRNVKQVSMPLSGRYLVTADAFVHAVFEDTLWTLTFWLGAEALTHVLLQEGYFESKSRFSRNCPFFFRES
jgi:hypothetical protein